MRDERYAFGGHAGTVKAIREHREWHDGVNRTPEPGEVYGLSATCWKEAEHVRFLLARIAALEEALRGAVNTAHQTSEYHPRGTGAFAPQHGGQWKLCPDDLCVNARALLDSAFTARCAEFGSVGCVQSGAGHLCGPAVTASAPQLPPTSRDSGDAGA